MKHFQKQVQVLLAIVIIVSMLTACSGNTPTTTATSPVTTTQSAATTTATSSTGIDNSEFVELKMVMVGPEMDDYQRIIKIVNEKLKEDLNCSMKVEFLDWSEWATKYPLMFASGEDFDLCYASSWSGYVSQALKGAYMALDLEEVQKYMPRTYENITSDMWNGTKVNDEIYMIPQTGLQFTGDHQLFMVRGDLMEKYSITSIRNANDLIFYWEQVVANDTDLIPIAINRPWFGYWVTTAILGGDPWLGMNYGNGPYQAYDLSDPNNVKTISDDEWWAQNTRKLKLAQEFLERGFWSKDAMSQVDEVRAMFTNGISATNICALVEANQIYEQVNAVHPEWKIQIVDINPNLPAVYYPITGDGTALHAKTKNTERAMQVLDIISYDQAYYDLIYYGVEGQDYKLNTDGTFSWISNPLNVGFRGMNNNITRLSTQAAPNFKELLEHFKSIAFYPPMQSFNFINTSVITEIAAVSDIEAKYDTVAHLGFIDGDVDAFVAEFRTALEGAGLKTYQDELGKQVQEYMTKYYGK